MFVGHVDVWGDVRQHSRHEIIVIIRRIHVRDQVAYVVLLSIRSHPRPTPPLSPSPFFNRRHRGGGGGGEVHPLGNQYRMRQDDDHPSLVFQRQQSRTLLIMRGCQKVKQRTFAPMSLVVLLVVKRDVIIIDGVIHLGTFQFVHRRVHAWR